MIPYLASNFSPDHFKRMKVKLDAENDHQFIDDINNKNLNDFLHINPKNIEITSELDQDDFNLIRE